MAPPRSHSSTIQLNECKPLTLGDFLCDAYNADTKNRAWQAFVANSLVSGRAWQTLPAMSQEVV